MKRIIIIAIFILFNFVSCKAVVINSETGSIEINTDDENSSKEQVDKIVLKSLKLNKENTTLLVNSLEQLSLVTDPLDFELKKIFWSSSDETVVTVTEKGELKALKAGTATIVANLIDSEFYAELNVTVVPLVKEVESVSINTKDVYLFVDNNYQLLASILPSDATNQNITWTSSDPTVATVSNSGFVTAKKIGEAVVTVKTEDLNITDTSNIHVIRLPKVVSGFSFTAILKPDGTLWTFGSNGFGQLGTGNYSSKTTPVQIMSDVLNVSAGYGYLTILKTDNSVWTVGDNTYGQLGVGSTASKNIPTKILTGYRDVIAGGFFNLFITTGNVAWGTGMNGYRALNDGTNVDKLSPISILADIANIYAGSRHVFYLKTDGTLWAKGYSDYNQLGLIGYSMYLRQVSISDIKTMIMPNTGNHTLILKNNKTLWALGSNSYGQLGTGNTVALNSGTPVQIATNVRDACTNEFHTIIVKEDGTVWAAGYNLNGEFGNSSNSSSYTFVKIADTNNILSLTCGAHHTVIYKDDNTVWATGLNSSGQLGLGDLTSRNVFTKLNF